MALHIVSVFSAILLFYFAYRNWRVEQFLSVVSAAMGVLMVICLLAIYAVEREPDVVNEALPPPAPSRVR